MAKLTKKESDFCAFVVENGGDKLGAYQAAGYSQNMNTTNQCIQADKLFNKPKLALKIDELQEKANSIADEKFSLSVQERLNRLNFLYNCGIEETFLAHGAKTYQNLSVAKQSIEVMNAMLGVSDSGDVKPVKVQIGVVDAS